MSASCPSKPCTQLATHTVGVMHMIAKVYRFTGYPSPCPVSKRLRSDAKYSACAINLSHDKGKGAQIPSRLLLSHISLAQWCICRLYGRTPGARVGGHLPRRACLERAGLLSATQFCQSWAVMPAWGPLFTGFFASFTDSAGHMHTCAMLSIIRRITCSLVQERRVSCGQSASVVVVSTY